MNREGRAVIGTADSVGGSASIPIPEGHGIQGRGVSVQISGNDVTFENISRQSLDIQRVLPADTNSTPPAPVNPPAVPGVTPGPVGSLNSAPESDLLAALDADSPTPAAAPVAQSPNADTARNDTTTNDVNLLAGLNPEAPQADVTANPLSPLALALKSGSDLLASYYNQFFGNLLDQPLGENPIQIASASPSETQDEQPPTSPDTTPDFYRPSPLSMTANSGWIAPYLRSAGIPSAQGVTV